MVGRMATGNGENTLMTRIAIVDDYQNVALGRADWSLVEKDADITVFNDHLAETGDVAARLGDFDIVVIMRERTPFPRELFEKLPNLRLLITTGMRNASVDLAAAGDHGVVVCGTGGITGSTPELTWGILLALARNIAHEDKATREGAWQTGTGVLLEGKVLGIIGLGRIGSRIAKYGQAFGMEVVAWSQNLTDERCAEVGGVRRVAKQELLTAADFVSVHVVLSDRSRGLIGAGDLALMKPTALLVNTSRGPIVDTDALIAALEKRTIAGAAIDVFDTEPLPMDHPLLRAPNTVITPHLGYVTDEGYRAYFGGVVEDIRAFLDDAPVRVLNP